MKAFHLFIRTDGNDRIGLGHLYRTMAIASEIEAGGSGIGVEFVIGRKSLNDFRLLCSRTPRILGNVPEEEACEIASLLKSRKNAFLLVDSYEQQRSFYEEMRRLVPASPVLAVDDTEEKAGYPVLGVVNFNLLPDEAKYPKEIIPFSAIGPCYYPIRKLFRTRGPVRRHTTRASRILVSMGGADPDNQTCRIVRILKKMAGLNHIDVLCGQAFPYMDEIEKEAGDKRVHVHYAVADPAAVMKKADLAVTAGGVACHELIYLGVPVAVMVLADNQEPTAAAIERRKCGTVFGHFRSLSDVALKEKIIKWMDDPEKRRGHATVGMTLIDGRGCGRIASFLLDCFNRYYGDRYTIHDIIKEYEAAAVESEEHKKVKWATPEGMRNRYLLALDAICWDGVASWLDVGCGTGFFLETVEKHSAVAGFTGIDISPSLIEYARQKTYRTGAARFTCGDFLQHEADGTYDLVTAIGLLQKCGASIFKSVAKLAEFVKPGGQVFVTTKNIGWRKFDEMNYVPDPNHHWFSIDEIRDAFAFAGLTVTALKGFEPRQTGAVSAPSDSHSVFILARKGERS
ncbi:MAG: Ubiquinone biosynthesis O-methyltransferase, mitochondrial [Syntrophus sp. SKADARSKE-3]|nr:Ubiquinone biosynthesis O-methyltransferase, mitochondrial [Syntrophus sp. SKADARSKE-3]